MLARLLGAASEITFRIDPTLVAGIELARRMSVISNSWRDDLAKDRSRPRAKTPAMTALTSTWLDRARDRVATPRSGPIWPRSVM